MNSELTVKVQVDVAAEELFWHRQFHNLAKKLGCLASTIPDEAANAHVFDKAEIVMRHWKQSAALGLRRHE